MGRHALRAERQRAGPRDALGRQVQQTGIAPGESDRTTIDVFDRNLAARSDSLGDAGALRVGPLRFSLGRVGREELRDGDRRFASARGDDFVGRPEKGARLAVGLALGLALGLAPDTRRDGEAHEHERGDGE